MADGKCHEDSDPRKWRLFAPHFRTKKAARYQWLGFGAKVLIGDPPSFALRLLPEQPELRRLPRRLGEAEMAEGVAGQQAAARRALQEALLQQEGLDDVLDRVARLGERRRDGLDADRAAAEVHGEQSR